MCFSKGGRFVIKICLIKRITEVIRTQCQNFLHESRTPKSRNRLNYTVVKYGEVFLRSPKDSLKYFEISVPQHVRFTEFRKK